MKFHCETRLSVRYEQPTADFFAFVKNILPADKYNIFKTLFRYPVKTNEVTEICFEKLSRIFDGRNPAFNYQFMNSEQRDDWEWYRQNVLREPEIWATKGWDFFKTEINSILVVDIPAEPQLEVGDAANHTWKPAPDFVASEIYLGHPMSQPPAEIKFRTEKENAEALLTAFLKNLAGQIASGTTVALAVPAWLRQNGKYSGLDILDRLDDLGYNHTKYRYATYDDLLYYREGQIVARQIIVLRKK